MKTSDLLRHLVGYVIAICLLYALAYYLWLRHNYAPGSSVGQIFGSLVVYVLLAWFVYFAFVRRKRN